MTIKECIDAVDSLKPNQYTLRDKVRWLSSVDEGIINDVLKTHEGYDGRYDNFTGYTEDNLTLPLIVQSPYDKLYTAFLVMKIDLENGEIQRYNNSSAIYNSHMMEFRKYYNKTHMPLSGGRRDEIPPKKQNVGMSEIEFENLKRDLYYKLREDLSKVTSDDKIYSIVMQYVNNNVELLKGDDGYTPIKGVDYFTSAEIEAIKKESKGDDGISPIVNTVMTENGHRVLITDRNGTHAYDVTNGNDGISPSVKVTDIVGGHRVTITDANGTNTFDIMDGKDGKAPEILVEDKANGHLVTIGEKSFEVKDGVGIQNIKQTVVATEDNGVNLITITLTDGTQTSFRVKNGSKGSTGNNGDVSIEYVNNNLSNVLKGFVSGTIVSMKDVSPIEHKIDVRVTSNNIPLYPYDITNETIAGCPYTITDDGVINISGVSEGGEGYAIIKTMTLSPGDYTFKLEGIDGDLYGMLIEGDEFIVGETSPIYGFWDDMPFVYGLSEEKTVSLILKWLLEPEEKTFSWRIKPYLFKGTEIAPEVEVSEVEIGASGINLYDNSTVNARQNYNQQAAGSGEYVVEENENANLSDYIPVLPFTKITISHCNIYCFYDKDKKAISGSGAKSATIKRSIDIPKEARYIRFSYHIADIGNSAFFDDGNNVMVVIGEQLPAEYHPFYKSLETYFANSEGRVNIKSIYPTTTLYTDTVGVKIEATYNRDITKAYAEQQKRIETLEALLLDATTT